MNHLKRTSATLTTAAFLVAACGGDAPPEIADQSLSEVDEQAAQDVEDALSDLEFSEDDLQDDLPDEEPPPDPVDVSDTVEPLDAWTPEVIGGPLDDLHRDGVLHPPGMTLVDEPGVQANRPVVISELLLPGVADAEGVFEGYYQQYLDAGYVERFGADDGPTEGISGGIIGYRIVLEGPPGAVEPPGDGSERYVIEIEALMEQDDGVETFVRLTTTEFEPLD